MDSPAVRAKEKKNRYLHWVTLKSTGAKAETTGGGKAEGPKPRESQTYMNSFFAAGLRHINWRKKSSFSKCSKGQWENLKRALEARFSIFPLAFEHFEKFDFLVRVIQPSVSPTP